MIINILAGSCLQERDETSAERALENISALRSRNRNTNRSYGIDKLGVYQKDTVRIPDSFHEKCQKTCD